jgi:hypothetical protein
VIDMNRCVFHAMALMAVLCWLVAFSPASMAQGVAPYHGFQRFDPESDTTFPIGVHGGRARLKFLKDTLHIDYTQLYGQECTLAYLDSNAFHGASADTNLVNAQNRDFYRAAFAAKLKVVTAPCSVSELFDDCVALENYYGWNVDTVDAVGFTDPGFYLFPGWWRYDETFKTTIAQYDTVPNKRFFGATFLTQYLHGDTLMAGGSKSTNVGLHNVQNWYSHVGKPDSSSYFDIALTLRADSITSSLSPDTVLAYALLYRRDTSGQWRSDTISDCGCNFYYPMRKYAITKGMYTDPLVRLDSASGY